jgi:2'-5' RNA ligase
VTTPARTPPIAETAVLLLIPEADPVVGRWRDELDPSAADGVPAHVTVLYPWLPADEVTPEDVAALAEIVRRYPPLDLTFPRFGRFPDVLWLAPEPAEQIRRLTAEVGARWPAYPPYGGAFAEVVPHLTVAYGATAGQLAGVIADLERQLPIRSRLEEVALVAQVTPEHWEVRERFPLLATE